MSKTGQAALNYLRHQSGFLLTGSGPVVWFQKFEYAVGHWLQKTAEHVLGCVLCSPGCFSLFRGVALMDVNVVNMYTTKPTEARHYIQWDQGDYPSKKVQKSCSCSVRFSAKQFLEVWYQTWTAR